MDTNAKTDLQFTDGIFISLTAQKKFAAFEDLYLAVRQKEKRILSTEEIKQLPNPKSGPDYHLWKIRSKNLRRIVNYLSGENTKRILDIGCGNGFFANMLAEKNNEVVAVDVNITELKQASSIFKNDKIRWYYLDILNEILPEEKFDVITFNASLQYFSDPHLLLKTCFELLKPKGEIHILDSPFYKKNEQDEARERSRMYFKSLQLEELSGYYHHLSDDFLKSYVHEYKYDPYSFLNRLFKKNNSPFPWLVIYSPL